MGNGILARYATVLDALAAAPDGLSQTEVMQATGLPRGTVHRLINALTEVGYLARRDGRKIYRLGPRLLRLLHMGVGPAALTPLARPILAALAARFGETAFLAKLVGASVRSIAMVAPESDGQSYVHPGRAMPIHAAASAKAIFAYQDRGLIEKALAEPLPRFTDKTRTEAAAIRADLARVRRQGYAVCDEELDPGVLSLACPVDLAGAGVLYSIGMVGLSQRLGRHPSEDIVARLRTAAQDFARALPSVPRGEARAGP